MFPWVYDFQWTAPHIVFLGIFFSVLLLIGLSVVRAVKRSTDLLLGGRSEEIRWRADFTDLPEAARRCRHDLTGRLRHRVCPNGFGCGDCDLHTVLAAKCRDDGEFAGDSVTVCGVRMPLDRLYHRGHTWVRREPDGSCMIGPDEFSGRVMGSPEDVSLPGAGTRLQANGRACTFMKDGRLYRVLSPIDGTVISSGRNENDWWIRLRPESDPEKAAHLLSGPEIGPWLVGEVERIERMVAGESAGVTLADGGELMPQLGGRYPEKVMDDVRAALLLTM